MNGATVLILTYTILYVRINSIGVWNCATTYETEPDRILTATYTRSVEMLYPLWFALCVLFLVSSVTTAKECRHTPSVMKSKELVKNAEMGGHVWIHVYGLKTPLTKDPKHQPEVGKTMFTSQDAYYDAWNAFVSSRTVTSSTCQGSTGLQRDCIPVAKLRISTTAFNCTRIAEGLCSAATSIRVRTVVFAYHAKPEVGWILNTAYPSDKPSC